MGYQKNSTFRLFYSYSHKDAKYRESMETALSLLRDQYGILIDWSDQEILPGQNISKKIQEEMNKSDIFVFLLSPDFVASDPCLQEWKLAEQIAIDKPAVMRVPIILRTCSWKDVEGMSQLKALPIDGKPVNNFLKEDTAWQQIYEGLKALVEQLRMNFTVRNEYIKEIEETEFVSHNNVSLENIFVFPKLISYTTIGSEEDLEETIEDTQQLLRDKHTIIYGDGLSGKTALCRHLFLSLTGENKPVIYIDLAALSCKADPKIFRDTYQNQYHGDYCLWKKQSNKTVLLDNLAYNKLDYVQLAAEHFDQVLVTVSSDTFYSYFRDENRLATFRSIEILPLTHSKQEDLIRKRLALSGPNITNLDGQIDRIERRVNEVIINNKILPRYPFYVLSILQTYEGLIPDNLTITSYGHCYYVLIISRLVKSGIERSDAELNPCLNFLEQLAFEIYQFGVNDHRLGADYFENFVMKYKGKYLVKESTLNRLYDSNYGIVTPSEGRFRNPYMYHFFLGRFLARNTNENKEIIEKMLERSYITSNRLALIFTIHHTSDDKLIEDIVIRTMCALEKTEPATLDEKEAKIFEEFVKNIPPRILSVDTIESGRKKERDARDDQDTEDAEFESEVDGENVENPTQVVNEFYRIMKNSDILGQILKNKYGSLERSMILEIIETIADGGLRLIKLVLGDTEQINEMAAFVHKEHPQLDLNKIKQAIRGLLFLWTMTNIDRVVAALNKPEIRSLVDDVVGMKKTPAYDLIGYFLRLDTVDELLDEDYMELKTMLKKYRYPFLQRVLSIRTQHYLNTHRVHAPVEQSVCSLLGIKYQPRLKLNS